MSAYESHIANIRTNLEALLDYKEVRRDFVSAMLVMSGFLAEGRPVETPIVRQVEQKDGPQTYRSIAAKVAREEYSHLEEKALKHRIGNFACYAIKDDEVKRCVEKIEDENKVRYRILDAAALEKRLSELAKVYGKPEKRSAPVPEEGHSEEAQKPDKPSYYGILKKVIEDELGLAGNQNAGKRVYISQKYKNHPAVAPYLKSSGFGKGTRYEVIDAEKLECALRSLIKESKPAGASKEQPSETRGGVEEIVVRSAPQTVEPERVERETGRQLEEKASNGDGRIYEFRARDFLNVKGVHDIDAVKKNLWRAAAIDKAITYERSPPPLRELVYCASKPDIYRLCVKDIGAFCFDDLRIMPVERVEKSPAVEKPDASRADKQSKKKEASIVKTPEKGDKKAVDAKLTQRPLPADGEIIKCPIG